MKKCKKNSYIVDFRDDQVLDDCLGGAVVRVPLELDREPWAHIVVVEKAAHQEVDVNATRAR